MNNKMTKQINGIKKVLKTLTNNVVFNEKEHTYTIKGVNYTPVSRTIKAYSKGIDKIPKHILETSIKRGNEVHKFMENTLMENTLNNENDLTYLDEYINIHYSKEQHKDYLLKGINYLKDMFKDGWKVLSVEQVLYNTPNKVCGTADLIIYKITYESLEIKIVDWKTGRISISNHIQIEIYKRFLEHSLNRLKLTNTNITTELVCLKPTKEVNNGE